MGDDGLVAANGETRRLIEQGGIKLNDEQINNVDVGVETLEVNILQAGKRRFYRIFFT